MLNLAKLVLNVGRFYLFVMFLLGFFPRVFCFKPFWGEIVEHALAVRLDTDRGRYLPETRQ